MIYSIVSKIPIRQSIKGKAQFNLAEPCFFYEKILDLESATGCILIPEVLRERMKDYDHSRSQ